MIVAETSDRYRFVTQPDHAELAGQFADHWGTETFARPDPDAALVVAAYTHDVGWWEYDSRPHLDADGKPVDFREMPAETWIDLYDEGIDAVVELDAYAGLLVSMHGAGLRNQRYGLSPEWPETPAAYTDFVDREEARQRRLLADVLDEGRYLSDGDGDVLSSLHESGSVSDESGSDADDAGNDADGAGIAPDNTGSRLWADYRRLQAWDTLSLAFCVTESPPGYEGIGKVPTAAGREDETLSIARTADGTFSVDPYPFDASPLVASVPTRSVRKEAFDGDSELVDAYYAAGREAETVTLHRRGE